MKRIAFIFLLAASGVAAPPDSMTWVEFYIQPTGSNLNSGSTATDAATLTYAGGTFVRSTRVFTVASGNPSSDGVVAGQFASIYTTAGATTATYVGRVSAATTTTITIDATAFSGLATSVSETASAATCKIGGAWSGPAAAEDFPFGLADGALRSTADERPRVNIKGDGDNTTADYNVTAQMSASTDGVIRWEGYTTTVGDGGKAVFDGGSGTYYNLLAVTQPLNDFANIIFQNNGGTGASSSNTGVGVYVTTAETYFYRCVFRGMRTGGITITSRSHMVECEAYGCNTANASARGGIEFLADGCNGFRLYSHHNTGSNAVGIMLGGSAVIESVFESNGGAGIRGNGDKAMTVMHCDIYNNGGDGIRAGTTTAPMLAIIENNNILKNTGYGINFLNDTNVGVLYNNRYGAGTMANTSGTTSTQLGMDQQGNASYANDVHPWNSPSTGDFSITLAAAKNAGRGVWTQSGASVTLGYPDIGAAQFNYNAPAAGDPRAYRLNLPILRRR